MLSPRQQLVAALQQQLQRKETVCTERIATGSPAFDAVLRGGFRRGSLVEWLGDEGSGATALAWSVAWSAAAQVCGERQLVVIVDPQRRFYPSAAARSGDLRNIVIAHPANRRDQEWTLNQALGCAGVAAVLSWPEKLDDRAFRRLQLAAERGRTLGLIVRDSSRLGEPSWADVRLLVRGLPTTKLHTSAERRRFEVAVERCRGSAGGQAVEVELNEKGLVDVANPLPLVSQLAGAAAAKRTSRA
jgi:hypothetical protein